MKVGDRVVCVNAEETCQLREGQFYTIREVKWAPISGSSGQRYKYVFLKEHDVEGLRHVHYHVSHFKKYASKSE